jgi:hypothetical protein
MHPVAVIGSGHRCCAACLLSLDVVVVPPAVVPPVTVIMPPVADMPPIALLPLAKNKDVRRAARVPPVVLLPLAKDGDVRGAPRVCPAVSEEVGSIEMDGGVVGAMVVNSGGSGSGEGLLLYG